MATNEFLPFCPTDTGTNLLTEAEYTAAADRVSGNKPGIATSKLNNKALRQAAAIASVMAQFVSDTTTTNVVDDADAIKLLAQVNAAMMRFRPTVTTYTTGSGTHNRSYIFAIVSGSATLNATYTNNGITYTVLETVASGLYLRAKGSGAPTVNGTLTKASGTGDTTLTFYAVRMPIYYGVVMSGGGGGGAGSGPGTGPNGGLGGDGGTSTFGSSLLTATGGIGGGPAGGTGTGGAGGTATINSPASGLGTTGGQGVGIGANETIPFRTGCLGGANTFGGAGTGFSAGNPGGAGATNTGAGGAGGALNPAASGGGGYQGAGGGAGAYIDAEIPSPSATYAYAVGASGTAGTAGTSSYAGGLGGNGIIMVTEYFQ